MIHAFAFAISTLFCYKKSSLWSISVCFIGISGERIWMELKKILTGEHAAPIIRVMIESGMGPYIGT